MKFLIIQDIKKKKEKKEERIRDKIDPWNKHLSDYTALIDFIDDWILERSNPRIDT